MGAYLLPVYRFCGHLGRLICYGCCSQVVNLTVVRWLVGARERAVGFLEVVSGALVPVFDRLGVVERCLTTGYTGQMQGLAAKTTSVIYTDDVSRFAKGVER